MDHLVLIFARDSTLLMAKLLAGVLTLFALDRALFFVTGMCFRRISPVSFWFVMCPPLTDGQFYLVPSFLERASYTPNFRVPSARAALVRC